MTLELISKDIFSRADAKIQSLEEEKTRQIEQAKALSEKELKKFKDKLQSNLDEDIKQYKEKILGNYQREAKKIVLQAKVEVFNEVYKNTLDELSGMSDLDKKSLYKRLISIAKEQLDLGIIICSRNDKKLVEELSTKDIKINVEENLAGGLKFESSDSKQLLNLSFQSLVDDYISENNEEIQRKLYNGVLL